MCYRFPLQVYVHKYTTLITSVCVNLVISSNCPSWLGLIIRPKRGGFTSEYVAVCVQLDAGAVYYEHQMPPEPFWVLKDSVELSLTSPPATELQHSLPVTVSYYAANRNVSSQLWKNKGSCQLNELKLKFLEVGV